MEKYEETAEKYIKKVKEYATNINACTRFESIQLSSMGETIAWISNGKIYHPRGDKDFYSDVCSEWMKPKKSFKKKSQKQDVYFIQGSSNTPIKIGISNNIVNRLANIQTAYPYKLSVLATIKNGGSKMEKYLHTRFADIRLMGEWFLETNELLEVIEHAKNN